MNVIADDFLGNLNLFAQKPGEFQKHIFKQWNLFIRDKYNESALTDSEHLKKQLKYLFPYQFLLTSPFYLPDIQKGIEIIRSYYLNKENGRIVIYSDRDADGICSASILFLFLRDKLLIDINNITMIVPGEEDKYGLSPEIISRIISHDPAIVITLDNGSSNRDSFLLLKKSCPDVQTIIIDHHSLPKRTEDYPEVDAFINPVMFPDKNPLRNLCTAGLVYMFVQGLTYSLTQEYNKTYLLRGEDDIYARNGVPVETTTFDKIFNFDEGRGDGENFREMWEQEKDRNFRFSKVAEFADKNPGVLGNLDKFQIFKLIKMPKILYALEQYLPLAAIGTIADSMQLTDDNRIIVSEGLSVINNSKGALVSGLREILKVLEIYSNKITEQDMAFSICPLVNAAGRMGQAHIALNTFISKELIASSKNAALLKEENEKRKDMSLISIELLENSVTNPENESIVVAYHQDVHRGISGLLASKLAERYEKPAMVLVNDGEYIRGSVRAFKNENVLSIIQELSPWLVQYGGHIQAAGFSLEYEKKDAFIKSVIESAGDILQKKDHSDRVIDYTPVWDLFDHEVNPVLWKEIQTFAPYGPGNSHPLINIRLSGDISYKYLGKTKKHIKLQLSGIRSPNIEAVWFYFNRDIDKLSNPDSIIISAEPQINYFRGAEKLQLRVTRILDC